MRARHEKVQENCIDLVGRIADRGAEYAPCLSLPWFARRGPKLTPCGCALPGMGLTGNGPKRDGPKRERECPYNKSSRRYVSAREWMRICFELLEMLKAHKKVPLNPKPRPYRYRSSFRDLRNLGTPPPPFISGSEPPG